MQGRHSGEPLAADWERARWVSYADRLLAGAMAHATPDHARITLPGAAGGYSRAVDGLEGFARTFILAAFRLAGEQGRGLEELADFYARGVTAGTDPDGANRWVRMDSHPQAKVEAASIALALDLTRPWIWDRLTSSARERVIEYLSPVVGDETYPRTNWLWFRVVVETFLRSVGGPWSRADIDEDLALHDSFYRADGWLSDGAERAYDHYTGWALHLYPVLWARMSGAGELAGERSQRDVARLDRFLVDALALVGGTGSPLIEGRSLSYRFAAAAPFWAGVLAGVRLTPLAASVDASGAVPVAVGGSTWQAHWLTPDERQQRHGSGLAGIPEVAGRVTVVSIVRGPWEFRLVRVDDLATGLDPARLRLRIGGWALSAASPSGSACGTTAQVTSGTRRSCLTAVGDTVHDDTVAGWASRKDASTLGPVSAVPYLELPVEPGRWVVVLSELSGAGQAPAARSAAELSCHDGALTAALRWPDGAANVSRLPEPQKTHKTHKHHEPHSTPSVQ